jgi:hypothetical protein
MSFNSNYIASRVFYDITVSNLNTKLTTNPELNFNETRQNPFVYNPQQYYLSIVRFSLDTCSLPIFVPTIQSNQPDPNLTIYSVSMSYDSTIIQHNIVFYPQDLTQPLPNGPSKNLTGLQTFTDYYYVYNYAWWINIVNNALSTCFATLQSTYSGTLPTSNAPYFTWSTINNTATLVSDVAGYNMASSDYIGLFFNNALYQLFSSLPCKSYDLNSIYGLNYQIYTNSYGLAATEELTSYTAYLCAQEYSTISVWNPVLSIVFTSNTMPLVSEQLSAPILYVNGSTIQSTNTSVIQNIITDFESNDGQYKPNLIYQPTVFRYKDLLGSTPLNSIDIRCYWKNRTGSLIPFVLNSGCSATIKIMFALKGTEN